LLQARHEASNAVCLPLNLHLQTQSFHKVHAKASTIANFSLAKSWTKEVIKYIFSFWEESSLSAGEQKFVFNFAILQKWNLRENIVFFTKYCM
jgi:hypothetical protein